MSNLINFFFSFDKLMKEKLVIAFYWLAIIVGGMNFLSEALRSIKLGPLASLIDFVIFFGTILLSLVTLRLVSEIAVAIFRMNNNLSPDGGAAETANIDPIAEAKKAAENAATRARTMSKSAIDKTKSAAENTKDSVEDFADTTVKKTKSVTRRKADAKDVDEVVTVKDVKEAKVEVVKSTKATTKPASKPATKPKKATAKTSTVKKATTKSKTNTPPAKPSTPTKD